MNNEQQHTPFIVVESITANDRDYVKRYTWPTKLLNELGWNLTVTSSVSIIPILEEMGYCVYGYSVINIIKQKNGDDDTLVRLAVLFNRSPIIVNITKNTNDKNSSYSIGGTSGMIWIVFLPNFDCLEKRFSGNSISLDLESQSEIQEILRSFKSKTISDAIDFIVQTVTAQMLVHLVTDYNINGETSDLCFLVEEVNDHGID